MDDVSAERKAQGSEKTIQSVDRALGILEVMARKRGEGCWQTNANQSPIGQ